MPKDVETLTERVFVNFSKTEMRIIDGETFKKGFTNPATFLRTVIVDALKLNAYRVKRSK